MNQPRKKLLTMLAEGGMSIKDLASNLNSSELTVRRALKPLIEEGSISYYRGKVTLNKCIADFLDEDTTDNDCNDELIRLARIAANQLAGGEVIFIDGSAACAQLLPEFVKKKPRLVVTNSIDICADLAAIGVLTKLTGGDYNPFSRTVEGSQSIKFISTFNFDVSFISAKGINERYVTENTEESAVFLRTVAEHSTKVVFIMEREKHGKSYQYVVADCDCVTIVSDK